MRLPKPLLFLWKNVQMCAPQPSGYSKTLIMDSQQPPADSKTIYIYIYFQLKNVQMSSRQASHLLNITQPSSVITWLHSSLLGIPNHRYFIGKVCKRVHDSLLEILNNFLEILKPSIFHWNNNKIASQQFLWYYKSYIMVAQQLFCVWRETLVRTLVWKMTELP